MTDHLFKTGNEKAFLLFEALITHMNIGLATNCPTSLSNLAGITDYKVCDSQSLDCARVWQVVHADRSTTKLGVFIHK